MRLVEVNFDGLVGPTHNYAGLSFGNVASTGNAGEVSRPRRAVLQGLAKMKALQDLGVPQAVLPPLERPDVALLRRLGFRGSDAAVVESAARTAPSLLVAASSASAMWTANAGTFVPGADAADGRPHLIAANLVSTFHRSIEAEHTSAHLARVFPAPHFVHHAPLPAHPRLGDEGAANHTRFEGPGGRGLHCFVFGAGGAPAPVKFPARQSREASEAVARVTGLGPESTLFVQQNPAAIDAGAFHNDVVAVGHRHVLLAHEEAFLDAEGTLAALRARIGARFEALVVRRAELTVEEAVATYLFNSQIVTLPDGSLCLVAPEETAAHPRARAVVDRLLGESANLRRVVYLDLRESMRNGGGPACLRFRAQLSEADLAAVHPECLLTDARYGELVAWAEAHYRESLAPGDLADPELLVESRRALEALTHILRLPRLYPFQQ